MSGRGPVPLRDTTDREDELESALKMAVREAEQLAFRLAVIEAEVARSLIMEPKLRARLRVLSRGSPVRALDRLLRKWEPADNKRGRSLKKPGVRSG